MAAALQRLASPRPQATLTSPEKRRNAGAVLFGLRKPCLRPAVEASQACRTACQKITLSCLQRSRSTDTRPASEARSMAPLNGKAAAWLPHSTGLPFEDYRSLGVETLHHADLFLRQAVEPVDYLVYQPVRRSDVVHVVIAGLSVTLRIPLVRPYAIRVGPAVASPESARRRRLGF